MVTVDTVLDLLSETRRRYVLYYLDNQQMPVQIDELAAEVARMEAQTDGGAEVGTESHDSIRIELRHRTLPRAAEAEFVEYDADSGEIRLTGSPPRFEAIMTVAKVLERTR